MSYFQPSLQPISGFYYRMPIMTIGNGEVWPKYKNSLATPYFGIIYPTGDKHQGLMIVKTLYKVTLIISDIEILSQTNALGEIYRIMNAEIAI